MNSGYGRSYNNSSNHRDKHHLQQQHHLPANLSGHNNRLRGLGLTTGLGHQNSILGKTAGGGATISLISTGNSTGGGAGGASNKQQLIHHPTQPINTKPRKTSDLASVRASQNDYNLVSPIRQTASIFKQPVTVYKDHKSKVKSDLKTVNKEKPSQLFWVKRLGDVNPQPYKDDQAGADGSTTGAHTAPAPPTKPKRKGPPPDIEIMEIEETHDHQFRLPKKVDVVGPDITNKMLLASISTHLHLSKDSAYGQNENLETINKNPTAFINPTQPLMLSMTVSDSDIAAAENRVRLARNKLAQAIKGVTA